MALLVSPTQIPYIWVFHLYREQIYTFHTIHNSGTGRVMAKLHGLCNTDMWLSNAHVCPNATSFTTRRNKNGLTCYVLGGLDIGQLKYSKSSDDMGRCPSNHKTSLLEIKLQNGYWNWEGIHQCVDMGGGGLARHLMVSYSIVSSVKHFR